MTNKNKRTKVKDPKAKEATNNAKRLAALKKDFAAVTKQPTVETSPGLFSRGQLISLVFICMGVSRLLLVGSAIRKESHVDAATDVDHEDYSSSVVSNVDPSSACVTWLNDTALEDASSACVDDGLNALLKFKYSLGWLVTMMVFGLVLQCWHQDNWLLRLNVGLLGPILMGSLTMLETQEVVLKRSRVMEQFVMAFVLSFIGAPPSLDFVPFLKGHSVMPESVPRRNQIKSLQSLMLMALASANLFQGIVQWALPLLTSFLQLRTADSVTEAANDAMIWMNQELLEVSTETPAALVVLAFLVIDKIILALVFFFAVYYLPEQQQRTMLLYTSVFHFISGTYQWPYLEGLISSASNMRMIDFTIAGFGLLTWLAPPITWKKKIA